MRNLLTISERLVRLPEVETIVGFKKSTIWAKVKEGTFPKPIKLADRITVWKLTDLDKWVKKEIEAYENDVIQKCIPNRVTDTKNEVL